MRAVEGSQKQKHLLRKGGLDGNRGRRSYTEADAEKRDVSKGKTIAVASQEGAIAKLAADSAVDRLLGSGGSKCPVTNARH